jgi:hypothetical protein
VERNGSGGSALLGLDGFVDCAQLLYEDTGEWWLVRAARTTVVRFALDLGMGEPSCRTS